MNTSNKTIEIFSKRLKTHVKVPDTSKIETKASADDALSTLFFLSGNMPIRHPVGKIVDKKFWELKGKYESLK